MTVRLPKLGALRPRASDTAFTLDNDSSISLHFDYFGVQSVMKKENPNELVLSYTRAMMSFSLFLPQPEDILIIGLGGGSMAKFCAQRFPSARITVVEVDASVIALREKFHVPPDSDHFRVVHAEGAKYLARQRGVADVILVDAYDKRGLPPQFAAQFFFDSCVLALRSPGVLSMNFAGGMQTAGGALSKMRTSFDGLVYRAKTPNDNIVSIALKGLPAPDWTEVDMRAAALKQEAGLDLFGYTAQLRQSAERRPSQQLLADYG